MFNTDAIRSTNRNVRIVQLNQVFCYKKNIKSNNNNLYFSYLARFNEEIETIKLKQSISKNRANQHASRLSILKMNIEREKGEYDGAGIGMCYFVNANR